MGLKSRLIRWAVKGISENYGTDEMIRAIYEFYGNGVSFVTDNTTYSPIRDAYEVSPEVFGIADKIATYFANVDYIPCKIGTEDESELDPLKDMFGDNSIDMTLSEFKKLCSLFGLIYGNIIRHTPKLKYGNNAGQIIKMAVLPVQNIEIVSGGVENIVEGYKFTVGDQRITIPPDEIWHSRTFLNLDYDNGKNFMGISPIKVAAKLIEAQNGGYELTANTYKNPLPPAIIANKAKTDALTPEQRQYMDRLWREKTKGDKAAKPFWTTGDLQVIKMGYDNFKDLNTIENSENGIRVLCNVWGVPSTLFNDSASSTYNNKKEAKKDMYEGRIIPDTNAFLDGLNRLMVPYGVYYRADWSKVAALQQDNLEKARIYDMGIKNRSVKPQEFRTEVLGLEELTPEELEELQMNSEFSNQDELQRILEGNNNL